MSLCVKLFQKNDELFSDELWRSEFQKIVVCPSPAEADRLRKRLAGVSNLDVITISKFISNQFSKLESAPEISRKADLMLRLSIFWKRVFPEFGFERFTQCFTLLTELRGTSVNLETLQEVISHYHPEVAEGIAMLWQAMQASELYDEHAAYHFLSEQYRLSPSPFSDESDTEIIFYGFGHLSGVQVDLLKSIALRQKVSIPYRRELYDVRHSSDWISWLSTEEFEAIDNGIVFDKSFDLIEFSKNRMAEAIRLSLRDFSTTQFLLGTSNPEQKDYLEIPVSNHFFKTSADLFGESFATIENEVRQLFAENMNQLETATLQKLLQSKVNDSIQVQDFKLLKASQLLQETIEEWLQLATTNVITTTFDWEILRTTSRLNSPRIYQAPNRSGKADGGAIFAFNAFGNISFSNPVAICISSAHSAPKLGESEYSQEVASLLSSLGPRRRKELDFQLQRAEFRELLNHDEIIFFIENGLLEHDLGWAEMLRDIQFNKIEVATKPSKSRVDVLSKRELVSASKLSTISPSRLQTYFDCPRQYYYNFVEDVSTEPELEENLQARHLGEIEHEVVEKYLAKHQEWDEAIHTQVCNDVLNTFLAKLNVTLNSKRRVMHFAEIKHFSKNGIQFVLSLMQRLPAPVLKFEEQYLDKKFKGRIDLMIKCELGLVILDFKRSKASIPARGEHESFDKLQLWNYLTHANSEKRDLLLWGYVCLKDISGSLLYTSWGELVSFLDETFDESPKIHLMESHLMNEKIVEFQALEETIADSLDKETLWPAKPREANVCAFCVVSNVCARGLV